MRMFAFTPAVCYLAAGIFFHGTLSVCHIFGQVPGGAELWLHFLLVFHCFWYITWLTVNNLFRGCRTKLSFRLTDQAFLMTGKDVCLLASVLQERKTTSSDRRLVFRRFVLNLCALIFFISLWEKVYHANFCRTSVSAELSLSLHTQTSSFKTPGMCLDVPRSLRAGGKNILWLLSIQGKFSSVPQFKLPWIMDGFSESLGM